MATHNAEIAWLWHSFAELSGAELYAILAARQRVFSVEQDCAYLDADGLDLESWHLRTVSPTGEVQAYLRVLPPGLRYTEASIGRVLTVPEVRRQGLGRPLVAEGLRRLQNLFPGHGVRIGAQQYLENFYSEFGFVTVSVPYDEDGIPHIEMLKPPS
jgi:ElaA protein